MRRPQDAVDDSLSKLADAEVVMKMAADKAKGSSAFSIVSFVDPANRILLAFDNRAHDRLRFGEKAELKIELLAQAELVPATADRMLGIDRAQFGSLHEVPRKA